MVLSKDNQLVGIVLSREDVEDVKRIAKEERRTLSNVGRIAIEEFLEKRKVGGA